MTAVYFSPAPASNQTQWKHSAILHTPRQINSMHYKKQTNYKLSAIISRFVHRISNYYFKINKFNHLLEFIYRSNSNVNLQRIPEKDYLVHLVFAIVKLSAVSLNNPEALRVATELYKDCFEYAQKTNQVNIINKFSLE